MQFDFDRHTDAYIQRLAAEKVRVAISQLDNLILSDAWDRMAPDRQRALTYALEGMRRDVEILEALHGSATLRRR